MSMTAINTKALSELDGGRLAAGIDAEIKAVVRDMCNRPGDNSARKVTVEINLKPDHLDEQGDVDSVTVSFGVKSSIPKRQTRKFVAAVDAKAQRLSVNEFSPDNPNQGTLIKE